jgi:hypothetical protein
VNASPPVLVPGEDLVDLRDEIHHRRITPLIPGRPGQKVSGMAQRGHLSHSAQGSVDDWQGECKIILTVA